MPAVHRQRPRSARQGTSGQLDDPELLSAFKSGEGADLIRDLVRLSLQELVELEASSVIGAAR